MAEWLRRQTQVLVNFVGVSSILTGCIFLKGEFQKKWRSRVSIPVPHALSYTLYPVHPSRCTKPMFKSPHGKFFCKLPECHPPSRIMRIFQKMSFCPPNSETQTFRQVQCAEPWLAWCVVIPEAVTEETDFLVPKINCLNKLRDKSRTDIDCVGFCACESAVSR